MNHATTDVSPTPTGDTEAPIPLVLRSSMGGVLMGLANLVPGISGGTMLLAAGIYPRFIQAIADLTTFRLRRDSLLVFLTVAMTGLLAIVLLAGPVKMLVVEHRWVMYSLFIGLTLGGVPIVWKLVGKPTLGMWLGAAAGFTGMATLALLQSTGDAAGGVDRTAFFFMLLAGVAGASAMILPGVSGGYLLLVLGVYVPILSAIDQCRGAVRARDLNAMMEPIVDVVLPVGLGVVVGVVLISNVLKWLLQHHAKPTLGVLLGLLIGAVVGLWPFQQGVAPEPGSTFKGQTVVQLEPGMTLDGYTAQPQPDGTWQLQPADADATQARSVDTPLLLRETLKPIKPEDYATRFFQPSTVQVGGAVGLMVGGFVLTLLIGRLGRDKPTRTAPAP